MGNLPPVVEPQIILPRDADVLQPVDTLAIARHCQTSRDSDCCICLEPAATYALPCGHTFHQHCLDQWLTLRPTCPTCSRAYGPQIGSMPDGEMSWYRTTRRLSGSTCNTIVLHFNFPAGVVEGQAHARRTQHAYLPDDEQGQQLLALFQLAFRRRVLFSLGHSLTTGRYMPIFAIHLKTSTSGGPTCHGFPDPNYFTSALEELRTAGIEPSIAISTAIDVRPTLPAHFRRRSFSLICYQSCQLLVFTCRFLCRLCLLSIAPTSEGRCLLLPIIASAAALCWPDWLPTLLVTVVCLLYVLQDNTTFADYRAVEQLHCVVSVYIILAAGLYVLMVLLSRGRCDRPFQSLAQRMRSLFHSALMKDAVLSLLLLHFKASLPEFVFWMAILCMLEAAWSDSRRHCGRGPSMDTDEALPASRNLPTVRAALAAAPLCIPAHESRAERLRPVSEQDWVLFECASSLRGRTDAMELQALITPEDDLMQRVASIAVRQMLQNELELGEDYCVFYHSYSASCILYELQAALAIRILGYPADGPPVLRLPSASFKISSINELLEVRARRGNDHATEFRQVAISAFVSCFASGGYGQSMLTRHFLRGYFGGGDLGDMTGFLEEALRCCGVSFSAMPDLVMQVLEVGQKWGLDMSRYADRGSRLRVNEQAPTCPGHLLQVFVHSSVVDAVSYGSLPLGRAAPGGIPMSAWLARQCPLDGQARLLVHPDLFVGDNRGLVRMFTHSASPIYGPAQRQRLLQDLDAVLAPHFADAAALELARAGLRIGGSAQTEPVHGSDVP